MNNTVLMQVSDSFGMKMIPFGCEICFPIIRNPVRLNRGGVIRIERVVALISHSFIIDRSESERYGLKRNGYHSDTCIRANIKFVLLDR